MNSLLFQSFLKRIFKSSYHILMRIIVMFLSIIYQDFVISKRIQQKHFNTLFMVLKSCFLFHFLSFLDFRCFGVFGQKLFNQSKVVLNYFMSLIPLPIQFFVTCFGFVFQIINITYFLSFTLILNNSHLSLQPNKRVFLLVFHHGGSYNIN